MTDPNITEGAVPSYFPKPEPHLGFAIYDPAVCAVCGQPAPYLFRPPGLVGFRLAGRGYCRDHVALVAYMVTRKIELVMEAGDAVDK